MPELRFVPADRIAPERLHAAFGAAFADYLLGPFGTPLAQWPVFLGRQGVDLAFSEVALQGDAVLAFSLVAPRPETGSRRLATLGAVPAARGSGAAPALLDRFMAQAAAAGVAAVELECFAQNPRALRLYEGRGFAVVDALYGYRGGAGGPLPGAVAEPEAIAVPEAFAWLDAALRDGVALPLQVTSRSLRALPVALQAWRRGGAQLVFSQAAEGPLAVHCLVDRAEAQEDAFGLVAALLSAFPGQPVTVPQLQRTSIGGAALARAGFEALPLHQVWMRRLLAA